MLTTLMLHNILLEDENINTLNKYFPNLQVLELLHVKFRGVDNTRICLFNLKTCVLGVNGLTSLTLVAPNLITLNIPYSTADELHVEAPMVSDFHLFLYEFLCAGAFTINRLRV